MLNYQKYLKYKNKYFSLKKQLIGGSSDDFNDRCILCLIEFTDDNLGIGLPCSNCNKVKIHVACLEEYNQSPLAQIRPCMVCRPPTPSNSPRDLVSSIDQIPLPVTQHRQGPRLRIPSNVYGAPRYEPRLPEDRIGTLNRNVLERLYPDNLNTIELIVLDNWGIDDIDPNTFIGLNNLMSIRLNHNNINNIQGFTFNGLPNLINISLSFNNITSLESNAFNNLQEIQVIRLDSNPTISRIEQNTFNNLPNLTVISLVPNRHSVRTVISLQSFYNVPNVEIEY